MYNLVNPTLVYTFPILMVYVHFWKRTICENRCMSEFCLKQYLVLSSSTRRMLFFTTQCRKFKNFTFSMPLLWNFNLGNKWNKKL